MTKPHSSPFDQDGRIHSLDGLRAFSILLVMLGHAAATVGAPTILDPFHSLGNYGVRFFFVISGFLITHLLLNELEKNRTIDLRAFFMRRVLRIFPAYYTYIFVSIMLGYFAFVDVRAGDVFHAATYTMNFHDDRGWQLNHTWSLAVEEQFYLLWPMALLFLGIKRSPKFLLFILLAIPMIRLFMWVELEASPSSMTRHFQAVADALALGCLLAFLFRNNQVMDFLSKIHRGILWISAIGLLAASAGCYLLSPGFFYVFGQTLANVGAAMVIYLCLSQSKGLLFWLLNNKLASFIGALSYSLYLWQEPFLNSYETGVMQSFPANIALTFIAAMLSYHFIEIPAQKFKKRIPSSQNAQTLSRNASQNANSKEVYLSK